jgi:hypothetical protein
MVVELRCGAANKTVAFAKWDTAALTVCGVRSMRGFFDAIGGKTRREWSKGSPKV